MFSWRTQCNISKKPQKNHTELVKCRQSRLEPKSLEENVGFCTNLVEFPIEPQTCFAAPCKRCLCKIKGWALTLLCSVRVKSSSTENAEERWGGALCLEQCHGVTHLWHPSLWWQPCEAQVGCLKNCCLSKLLVLSAKMTVLCRQRQQIKSQFPFPSQGDALGFAFYPLLLFLSILLCSSVWVF